ncbi:MAG TPA: hypothetical protein VKZ18_02315 [Polyangia bacterium]|nr:hypothetical protein [Polyangia bacterium]
MIPEDVIGQPVTIEGVATDVHAGAIVVTAERDSVFIADLEAWPARVRGMRVEARGVLRRTKLAPDPFVEDGVHVAGLKGTQLVLERAQWRVIR